MGVAFSAALALGLAVAAARQGSASPVALHARNNGSGGGGTVPTAVVANGTLEGVVLPTFNQEAFLGIPYAQPPVGDLRLRRARALESAFDGGKFEATEYSPFCPGIGADNYGYEMSEDCLTLNVVRPAGTSADDKLPVGVWVHGGSFQMGGSGDRRYDGSWVVERSVEMDKPIMFVSVNYRVSSLGFMSSNELRAEGNVNLGLYDLRLALGWLQDNVEAFGGDPKKVTFWGESAGAAAISYELISYGLTSTSLFRGAILESGSPTGRPLATAEDIQPRFDAVVESAGCAGSADVLACLRGLSLEAFNASAAAYSWNPVVDGGIIPESSSDAIRRNAFVRVPLLVGTNTDEGTAFGTKNISTDAQLAASLQAYYPKLTNESTAKLLELYPNDPSVGSPYDTGDAVLASGLQDKRSNALTGDLRYIAGKRLLAEKYAAADQPVFAYRFNQPAENGTIDMGVPHFTEVAYVFSNPMDLGSRDGDAALAQLMTSQWVSFIHDGTPNNHGIKGAPKWPDYRSSASNFVFSRKESTVEKDDFRQEGIDFIKGLGWELSA
ncbi:alpha/beta-hydrolase [Rhodotorula diobovata]|uniref:Alpha/beta-hydrolase n=1 Tax=Rhodotorula diobovata TaxID=5288 RepID=A0A5C5G0L0_9BASI|nr:alpha/beta-hydrolase [Rhodotorula diobovata]